MTKKSKISFNITRDEDEISSVTAFIPGEPPLVANRDHPALSEIVEYFEDGAPAKAADVRELFDIAAGLTSHFEQVGRRLSIREGKLYLDQVLIQDTIADAILAFYQQSDRSFEPLCAFVEKIEANPNDHSREQLYNWLMANNFGIHPDGDIIAYKGVRRSGGKYLSTSSGHAFVNGREFRNAHIPTMPGAVVEMPRSEVRHDPSHGCASGLHAGPESYARDYGDTLLQVKINPGDVVSVPTDSNQAKMRVCRYRVIGEADMAATGILFPNAKLKTLHVPGALGKDTPAARGKRSTTWPPPKGGAKRAPAQAKTKKATPAKRSAVKKAPPKAKRPLPKYYEDMNKRDFMEVDRADLRWLAKEWGVSKGLGSNPSNVTLATVLAKEAAKTRRKQRDLPARSKKRQRTGIR